MRVTLERRMAKGSSLGRRTSRMRGPSATRSTGAAKATTDGPPPLPAVLTIDDERAVNESLGQALGEWGYPCYSAQSAGEGLRIVARRPEVQIVLCDVRLPDASGVQVLRAIKNKRPDVEVIMMTGYPTIASAVDSLQAGAYDYLSKPLILAEVQHLLGRLTERREESFLLAGLTGSVFISYARPDLSRAKSLYKRLMDRGYKPWMDVHDLKAGDNWSAALEKAIRGASFFVALISRQSTNRRGMLQKEIRVALEMSERLLPDDIYVIPVRLEECDVPESLSRFQWVDYFSEDGWHKLVDGIHAGLRRRLAVSQG